LIENRLRGVANVVDQVVRRLARAHAGVNEPDQVGHGVVAEQQVHAGVILFVAMQGVEKISAATGQAAARIAREN